MGASFKRSAGDWELRTDGGIDAQFLFRGENAIIVAADMPPGVAGHPRHTHHYDQVFYLISGTMQFELGTEDFTIGPKTLVYIPRGTPHCSWNAAAQENVLSLEMAAPAPHPLEPVLKLVESRNAGGRKYLVRSFDDVSVRESRPGLTETLMLQRSDGSEELTITVAQIEPGAGESGRHIHAFDQFYYVLEGELRAVVATEDITAKPGDMIVIPAGVAHRQCNQSSTLTRLLTIMTPSPELDGAEQRTDVEFVVSSNT